MSGGGITKIFSKVVKVFTKVVPIVLAAAAVVFTAGAGLAAAGVLSSTSLLGGGLGAAMSGAMGSMGLAGTTVGSVLAGAATSAAYGSAIGGVLGAVSGGGVMKGMQMGTLTGAVTGGVLGGLSGPLPTNAALSTASGELGTTQGAMEFGSKIDPIGNMAKDFGAGFSPTPGAANTLDLPAGYVSPGAPSAAAAETAAVGAEYGPYSANAAAGGTSTAAGAPTTTAAGQVTVPDPSAAAGTGGTKAATSASGGIGGWLQSNPQLASSAVGGIMQGGGAWLAGKDQADAQKQATEDLINGRIAADQAKADQIASNYAGTDVGTNGLLTQQNTSYAQAQDGTRPSPTQRYDPRAYNGQWVYNSQQGRIVFVPNAATA